MMDFKRFALYGLAALLIGLLLVRVGKALSDASSARTVEAATLVETDAVAITPDQAPEAEEEAALSLLAASESEVEDAGEPEYAPLAASDAASGAGQAEIVAFEPPPIQPHNMPAYDPLAEFKSVAFGLDVIPRVYTIKRGDTPYSVAQKFGLHPNYILWNNPDPLGFSIAFEDGVQLLIPPVNGLYYRWGLDDNYAVIEQRFGVEESQLKGWNPLLEANGVVQPNTMIFIPGGTLESLVDLSLNGAPIEAGNAYGLAVFKARRLPVCEPQIPTVGDGDFIWPIDNPYVSGYRYSEEANHQAVDLGGDTGDPIYAIDNGVVIYTGWYPNGYGAYTVIDHFNGWYSLYAHMSAWSAACGESVRKGQEIGKMGSTGNSSGPHLHIEIGHEGEGRLDPLSLFPPLDD